MRWRTGRRSSNVIDRRRAGLVGGGIGAVVLTIVALLLAVNPGELAQVAAPPDAGTAAGPPTDEGGEFVAVVLADTEDTWNAIFAQSGSDYPEPRLVLFSG